MDSSQCKILMIDDDEDDYILTRHMLFEARRESYCLDWAGTYDEGWEKLKTDRYDAILMDYDLGPHNGLELTRKAMAAGCRAPIILYTGRGSYEVDLEAMEAGATLYLTKGETSALMLERSIRYAMDHKKAEQDLANANALLEKQKQELDRRLKERSELLKSITDERMQAEERQARIQTILDTLPVGIAILDNQGNLVESNDQAAVSWGVPTKANLPVDGEAYKGQSSSNQGQELREATLQKILKGESLFGEEFLLYRFDGKPLPALVFASPIKDQNGRQTGAVVVGVDISEQKKMEAELKTSKEKYRELIQHAPAAIYEIDFHAMHFTSVNDVCCELTGYSREEMLTMNPLDLLDEVGQARFKDRVGLWLEGERPEENIAYRVIKKDGKSMYMLMSSTFTTDEDGRPLGATVVAFDITGRKLAEERLQESESRLSAIVDSIADGFCAIDRELRFTHVNDAAAEFFKQPRETLLGKFIGDVFPPFIGSFFESKFREVWETGKTAHFEASSVIEVGNVIDVYAYPGKDNQTVLFRDISEQKQIAANLQQRMEEIETLMNLLPAPIWVSYNPECEDIVANQYAQDLLEKPTGDESSRRRYFRNGKEISSAELPMQEAVARNVELRNTEFEVLLPSGSKRVLFGSATPLRGKNGAIRGCVGAFLDITKRKEAEEHTRRKNATLKGINRIFEQALTCETMEQLGSVCLQVAQEVTESQFGLIGEIDEKSNTMVDLSISKSGWDACQMPEYESQEKKLPRYEIRGMYKKVLQDGKGFYTNEPASHPASIGIPDGHPVLKSLMLVPLVQSDKVVGIVGLANRENGYSSEQWEAAQTLAPAIVQAFMSKRVEEMLVNYAEQLQRSNRELEDFAYVASHDLREPLRKIETFGKMLMEEAGPALSVTGKSYIERMQNSAIRMRHMIDDLLALSRVTTRGQPFREVDLNQVAQTVLDDLVVLIKRTKGEVEIDDLPVVQADPVQMHQLLQNLISNALKFHASGRPPKVRVVSRGSYDDWVEIAVEDNGIGFEPDQVETIFMPFQRLNGRSAFEGTGIGLSICQKIVERHGGTIEAQSEPGEGSSFVVRLMRG